MKQPAAVQHTEHAELLGPELAFAEQLFGGRTVTATQRAALELFDLGFNVGPLRPASKLPYLWRVLRATRLHPDYLLDVFGGRAGIFTMVGRYSHNLFVDDCETMSAAKLHAAEFERRGIHPWTVETTRGRHYWFLSPAGEVANVKGDDSEIRGNGCYVATPPSIHPSGMRYQWIDRAGELPPAVSFDELDFLPLKLAVDARRVFEVREAGPLDCLSRATREFLDRGAIETTRNRRLFSAACDMAGNGFAFSDARRMLSPVAQSAGLPRREAETTIRSAYAKPRTPAKQHRAPKPAPLWTLAVAFGQEYPWQRLTAEVNGRHYAVMAETARAVFIACCERARRDSAEVFRASTREVAELAGLRSKTAHRGLACLAGAGLLEHRGYSDYGASLFAFGAVVRSATNVSQWSGRTAPVLQHSEIDVFTRGALGQAAGRIWHVILTDPLTVSDLARRLKIHRSTVSRALGRLLAAGLAVREPARRWGGISTDTDGLREIAADYSTLGRGERRAQAHSDDRAKRASKAILWKQRAVQHASLGQGQQA